MRHQAEHIQDLLKMVADLRRQHEGDMELIRTLVDENRQATVELARLRGVIENLNDELAALRRMVFGKRSEKRGGSGNGDVADGGTGCACSASDDGGNEGREIQGKSRRTRTNTPRKRDYGDIPVDADNIIELRPDDESIRGARLLKTVDSWRIFYQPGRLFKVLYRRHIYGKDGRVIAPRLPWVPEDLRKRHCDVSLVAGLLVNKYYHHIPLDRQLRMLAHDSIQIARSTFNDWCGYGIDALEGIYQAIRRKVLSCDILNVDETVQFVLDTEKGGTRHGWDWGIVSPQCRMMYFTTSDGSRSAEVLDGEIAEYHGHFMQHDGYAAYDNVAGRTRKPLVQVYCMAHIRRKFYDCLKYHRPLASEALGYIGRMFLLERLYRKREFPPDEVERRRDVYLRHLLDRFRQWLADVRRSGISGESYIGKAVGYALERIDSFYVLCRNGLLELSNNLAERCMRGHTLGRKNYLFVHRGESAVRTCKIYSVMESCRMCGIDPYRYLVAVLSRSPGEFRSYEELLPCNIVL